MQRIFFSFGSGMHGRLSLSISQTCNTLLCASLSPYFSTSLVAAAAAASLIFHLFIPMVFSLFFTMSKSTHAHQLHRQRSSRCNTIRVDWLAPLFRIFPVKICIHMTAKLTLSKKLLYNFKRAALDLIEINKQLHRACKVNRMPFHPSTFSSFSPTFFAFHSNAISPLMLARA